ncbi:MAG: hypothetical protein HC800_04685 [Phormidesmis sp. RL_2_1]|nr:hypothetical protein [Phormidesmis sp. RL_2_1]
MGISGISGLLCTPVLAESLVAASSVDEAGSVGEALSAEVEHQPQFSRVAAPCKLPQKHLENCAIPTFSAIEPATVEPVATDALAADLTSAPSTTAQDIAESPVVSAIVVDSIEDSGHHSPTADPPARPVEAAPDMPSSEMSLSEMPLSEMPLSEMPSSDMSSPDMPLSMAIVPQTTMSQPAFSANLTSFSPNGMITADPAQSERDYWPATSAHHSPVASLDSPLQRQPISQANPAPDTLAPNALAAQIPKADERHPDALQTQVPEAEFSEADALDTELGSLRVRQLRSREDEELGILRLLQTTPVPKSKPKSPIAFLTGRLGYFSSENIFRSNVRLSEQVYQSGLTFYLFPRLSEDTSLYAIAETNLARYENFPSVNYNEIEFQFGIRQRIAPRTFAQIGWQHQRLYAPGYREQLFGVNAIDTLISHRSILNDQMWLDSFYQARLGFAQPSSASRFRQTFTLSLNYGITQDLRTSLLYQLDFDDYTQTARYDTYQQVLGVVSYKVTPESRISLFGGTRFGRSSIAGVNLNDTFYGAGLNVSLPLF